MSRKLLVGASLLTTFGLAALGASPASAFHGAWWLGFGTATGAAGTYNLEFSWGGQDAILQCGGGGCEGTGDGYALLTDTQGLTVLMYPFIGTEDVRNVFFTEDPTWCPAIGSLEVTPAYSLTYAGGFLVGVQRNCLSTGINNNDFTGTLLDFVLTVHSEGPFGVSHG